MSGSKTPKPQTDRVQECITILRKITDDLEIPHTNPSIRLLKKRMGVYWRDGNLQEDRIPLVGSNRYIMYKFPRWAHQIVEITLRACPITHQALPSDLAAEIEE
jgi:hypothetical protein